MLKLNKKGFTLIELLGVIVIIGVLSTIVIASISGVLKKSKKEYNLKQAKLFTTAAQTYFTDNKSRLPKDLFTTQSVTLQILEEKNYIKSMVDDQKRPYNSGDSKVVVKKISPGNYRYASILIDQDGKEHQDGEMPEETDKGQNFSITITFDKNPSQVNDLIEEADFSPYAINNIWYIRKSITIPFNISYSEGIVAYKYRLYKISKSNDDTKGKKYYESNYIGLDDEGVTSVNDHIMLSQKKLADGLYQLEVVALDKNGRYNSQRWGQQIEIDGTKPKCSTELIGEKGNDVLGIESKKKLQWYKADPKLQVKIAFTENNKYKYKTVVVVNADNEYDSISYGSIEVEENSWTTEILKKTIDQTLIGGNVYIYMRDKAGNEGMCKSKDQIYYDASPPTCTVTPDREPEFNGWYREDVELDYHAYDIGSGIFKYGFNPLGQLDNTAEDEELFDVSLKAKQGDTSSTTWTGKVMDQAGNEGICSREIKVDKQDLTCLSSADKGPDGLNQWYINPVGITGYCNDDKPSGCTRAMRTIDWDGDNIQESPGIVTDGTGRTVSCPMVSLKMEITPPEVIDSSSVIEYGSYAGQHDTWTNGAYTVSTRYQNSISGIAKIFRYEGNSRADIDPNPKRDTGQLSDNMYTSDYFKTETSADGREVCYGFESIAGNHSEHDFCEILYIDKTDPNLRHVCYCLNTEFVDDQSKKYAYVFKYKLQDDLSGLNYSNWVYQYPISHSNCPNNICPQTPFLQNNNYIYSPHIHFGYIGVIAWNGDYSATICDNAENCLDTYGIVRASSECPKDKYCNSHEY